MTFEEFEARVDATPDLELSWTYWNALLPETTGRALWDLFIWPAFRQMTEAMDRSDVAGAESEPDWFPNEGDRQWWREKHLKRESPTEQSGTGGVDAESSDPVASDLVSE